VNSVEAISEAMRKVTERAAAAAQAAMHDPVQKANLDRLAAESMATEALYRRQQREEAWRSRAVPERLWPMLHASAAAGEPGPLLDPTDALEAVGRFLAGTEAKTILVLAGGPGVGKTVAAGWGAAFHGGYFAKAIDLVRIGMFPREAEDARLVRELRSARLIVLDDLGAEPLDAKGYGIAAITDLVDRRYDGARKTIVTTNLPLDEFRERYGTGSGVRLWERVREVGRFVELQGESRRGARAAGVAA
jgi:DNA replication protein DnaC